MPEFSADRPENYYFGGGGDTFASPLAIFLLVLAFVLILGLPRRYAVIPLLLAGLLIPLKVSIVIGGIHLNSNRLLLFVAWLRLLGKGERFPARLGVIDKALLYGALVNSLCYVLVWREGGAILNRLGFLYSTLGGYFALRAFIRSRADAIRVIQTLAVMVAICAPLMWIEHATGQNPFVAVGGRATAAIRDGRLRAGGPFAHSSVAGTVGAVLLPLFVGLWQYGHRRWLAGIAVLSSCVVVFTSSSSTPLLASVAAAVGLAMWPLRKRMRAVCIGLVLTLAAAQLMMKAPLWFLIERVSLVTGGSGWHRAMLMDRFIGNFFSWWVIGSKDYPNWGWDMWDVDNAFVAEGLMGGCFGLYLFLRIFAQGYITVGRARRVAECSKRNTWLIWGIGCTLLANMVGFFGIVYFDQSMLTFHALLVLLQITPAFAAYAATGGGQEPNVAVKLQSTAMTDTRSASRECPVPPQ